MAPTSAAALGVKGCRPTGRAWDWKDRRDVFAVVNRASAAVPATTVEGPQDARKRTGKGKSRQTQQAFAAHVRPVARVSPRQRHPRVVMGIGHSPWHRGKPIEEALRANPHLEFKRVPGCRPPLHPIERFLKKWRRRATHNRLVETRADRKASLRASRCDFQTVRQKGKSIRQGRPKKKAA